ncbi:MOSC N-terminal beta barrel domain-containing protein [Cyanobacteria bacterium FACHB-63]|nr:MOSC N-terminal beta barrel domain-containing protein [Cyanobacteria bacterium FACHB-63]
MTKLETILIYPIKSLDAISVSQAKILPGGSLEHDREFCIVDQSGKWVNGKRTAKIHQIRSRFDLKARIVTLSVQNDRSVSFHLDHGRSGIEGWLSDYFGFRVFLKQDLTTGFPDDPVSPGPTIVSVATLKQAASWFEGMTFEGMRSRLRTNLELSEVPAFWEEQLYSADESPITFQLGEVEIQGINSCQRCVVPTRDAISGKSYPQFQKIFNTQREEELPDWAPKEQFNHYYRMAVNTRIAPSEAGKVLKVGDTLSRWTS